MLQDDICPTTEDASSDSTLEPTPSPSSSPTLEALDSSLTRYCICGNYPLTGPFDVSSDQFAEASSPDSGYHMMGINGEQWAMPDVGSVMGGDCNEAAKYETMPCTDGMSGSGHGHMPGGMAGGHPPPMPSLDDPISPTPSPPPDDPIDWCAEKASRTDVKKDTTDGWCWNCGTPDSGACTDRQICESLYQSVQGSTVPGSLRLCEYNAMDDNCSPGATILGSDCV